MASFLPAISSRRLYALAAELRKKVSVEINVRCEVVKSTEKPKCDAATDDEFALAVFFQKLKAVTSIAA